MPLPYRDRHPLLWGYATEVVASGLICLLVELSFSKSAITSFLFTKKADIFFTVGLGAATCGIFFAAFIAFMCTDFGKKMREYGIAVEYLVAFLAPFMAFVFAAGVLHFIGLDSSRPLVSLAFGLLIYCAINCVTMAKNLVGLVSIWQAIERRSCN